MVAEGRAKWDAVEAFDVALVVSGSEIVLYRAQALLEIEPLAAQVQAGWHEVRLRRHGHLEISSAAGDGDHGRDFNRVLRPAQFGRELFALALCGDSFAQYSLLANA